MRTARRTRSLKVATLVGVSIASMLSSPLPAHATTLTIVSVGCERLWGGMMCDGTISGGTGGYTYSWSDTTQTYGWTTESSIRLYCEGSRLMTLTVKDSSNATASKTAYGQCGGPPD
jgi:hypothetical protein